MDRLFVNEEKKKSCNGRSMAALIKRLGTEYLFPLRTKIHFPGGYGIEDYGVTYSANDVYPFRTSWSGTSL